MASVGAHLSTRLLHSSSYCCQAVAPSHCSSNTSISALPQQSTSMLSAIAFPSICGHDVLLRTTSKATRNARTFMMLQGCRKSLSRLDFRSPFHRGVMWNDPPGKKMLLSRGGDVSMSSSSGKDLLTAEGEEIFFDGGVHYGDLLTNLVFGLTLVWLPLTLAAIFRNLFLRYRFTDKRITVKSGLIGGDRKDFTYDVVTDVKVVPRFIGEWGDMALELKDGTKVDLRSVPKFRQIAKYVEEQAASARQKKSSVLSPSGRGSNSRKGFS